MEKDLSLTELFDLYGGLLTERQRELFSSYYLYDLSLAEIAAPENMTRQGVYEQVKKVKEKLLEYERILKLRQKNAELLDFAKECGGELSDKIKEILGR